MARIIETATGPSSRSTSTRSPSTSSRTRCATPATRWTRCCSAPRCRPGIREQHDEFPLIADPDGQDGRRPVRPVHPGLPRPASTATIEEGDVLLTSDPYACGAAISHANDWLVVMPIFHDGPDRRLGRRCSGTCPTSAARRRRRCRPTPRTIFEEGVVIPPFKLYTQGELNEDALRIILNQVRMPDWNRADLNGDRRRLPHGRPPGAGAVRPVRGGRPTCPRWTPCWTATTTR